MSKKNELINTILYNMMNKIDRKQLDELKHCLQVSFYDYAINKIETTEVSCGSEEITEELLKGRSEITITLTFDKISSIDMDLGENGSISKVINSNYNGHKVAYVVEGDTLKVFENTELTLQLEAQKVEEQYYVLHEVQINGEVEATNTLKTEITKEVSEIVTDGVANIKVIKAKVYNAEDKVVKDITETKDVATIVVEADSNDVVNIDLNKVPTSTIDDDTKFVVEDSKVDFTVTENNDDYGFVGIKINNKVTSRDQFNEDEWTHNNSVHTWKQRSYTLELSEAQAVILEKWYTTGNEKGRDVEVEVDDGISAKLKNTDIGYAYTLANNIFSSGDEPLYSGSWQVEVTGATGGFAVTVRVYTSATKYTEYGMNSKFTIDATVTKVVIMVINPNPS